MATQSQKGQDTDYIHKYSRADAMEDGVLVAVEEKILKEAGFKHPMCLTDMACSLIMPTELEASLGQDFEGRLWDVLTCAKLAAKGAGGSSEILFSVLIAKERQGSKQLKQVLQSLKMICGPGDQREPVLTIMLPNED